MIDEARVFNEIMVLTIVTCANLNPFLNVEL